MTSVLIDEDPEYTVTFTPSDALSTDPDELAYQIRTSAGGTGTLLTSGTATSGVEETTDTILDLTLVEGPNTRYIRVIDGANNATDTAFTVIAELNPPSDEEVDEGLSGPNVAIFFTFERRTIDFRFLEDLTPAVRNCAIECINERDTALTATFDIDELLLPADFDPDDAFIAVNTTLRLPSFDKLFTIGLFRLDVADTEREPGQKFWPNVAGADLTDILETVYFDEPFSVDSGDSVLQACIDLVEGAGLIADFPAGETNADAIFPVGRIYDPKRSKRNILNDMLVNCIHWKKAHTTPTGRITSRYNRRPLEEPVAQVYSTTQEPRLVGKPWKERPRRQGRINRAVALIDDPRRDPEFVFLENADTLSPVSTVNIGASKPQEIDASFALDLDLAEEMATHFLLTEASKAVEADLVTAFDPRRQPHETYKLNIHDDLLDEDIENGTLWNVVSWRLEMRKESPGVPMQHRIVRAASPALTEVAQ